MTRVGRLLALPLACAPVPAAAQRAAPVVTPQMLRTSTPPALGTLLFGADAPAFTDSWVEGPTREWHAITVNLATTPVPTEYAGLCTVTVGRAAFSWSADKSREDLPVRRSSGPLAWQSFLLAWDLPSLEPVGSSGKCGKRKPLSDTSPPTMFAVTDMRSGAALPAIDPAIARFGLLAFHAAKKAETVPVRSQRCSSGAVEIPEACNDPAAFVRSDLPRQILGLTIENCTDGAPLCVDIALKRRSGADMDHVVVAVDATGFDQVPTPQAIRSIEVRAGSDPIA